MDRLPKKVLRFYETITYTRCLVIPPFDSENGAALIETIGDRHEKSSLIITSRLPVSKWFDVIVEKTIADAILDRIVHDAHRIELKGESMRKKRKLQEQDKTYE